MILPLSHPHLAVSVAALATSAVRQKTETPISLKLLKKVQMSFGKLGVAPAWYRETSGVNRESRAGPPPHVSRFTPHQSGQRRRWIVFSSLA
jgi:hypothetical protein